MKLFAIVVVALVAVAAAQELDESDKDAMIARLTSENEALRSKLESVANVEDVDDDDDLTASLEDGEEQKQRGWFRRLKKEVKKHADKSGGVKKVLKKVVNKAVDTFVCNKKGLKKISTPITKWLKGRCDDNFGCSRCGGCVKKKKGKKKKKKKEKTKIVLPCQSEVASIIVEQGNAIGGTFRTPKGKMKGYGDAFIKLMTFMNKVHATQAEKELRQNKAGTEKMQTRRKGLWDNVVQMINVGMLDDLLDAYEGWTNELRRCSGGKASVVERNTCTMNVVVAFGARVISAYSSAVTDSGVDPEIAFKNIPKYMRPTKAAMERINKAGETLIKKNKDRLGKVNFQQVNASKESALFYAELSNEVVLLGLQAVEDWRCDSKFKEGATDHNECMDNDFVPVSKSVYKSYYKKTGGKCKDDNCVDDSIPISGIIQKKTMAFNKVQIKKILMQWMVEQSVFLEQYDLARTCAERHFADVEYVPSDFFNSVTGSVEYFACMRSFELGRNDEFAKTYALSCGHQPAPDGETMTALIEEAGPPANELEAAKKAIQAYEDTDSSFEKYLSKCVKCSAQNLAAEFGETLYATKPDCTDMRQCSIQMPTWSDLTSGTKASPLAGFTAMLKMQLERNKDGTGQTLSPFAWNFFVRRFAEFAGDDNLMDEKTYAMAVQQMRALNPGETSADRRRLNMAVPNALS